MVWGFDKGDVVVQIGKPDKYVVVSRRYGVSRDGYLWQEYTLVNTSTRGYLYIALTEAENLWVKVGDWDFLHAREVEDE